MAADQLLDLIDGMTQDERRLAALDPGYIKIDDRKLGDLLRYMADFAGEINFYNEKNEIDGDWKSFFSADINILVHLISEYDLTTHLARYERLESRIQTSTNQEEAFSALQELFDYLEGIISMISGTRRDLLNGAHYNRSSFELAEILQEALQAGDEIKAYRAESLTLDEPHAPEPESTVFSGATIRLRILAALPHIRRSFRQVRSRYNNFLAVTSFHFKDQDLSTFQYQPHLALCITFLHLFQYLQEQLNNVPRQHLDFYFDQILGLGLKPARPDRVDIVFEVLGQERVLLKKGEELIAETPEGKLTYALDEDILVSKARIAAIKTVLLDEHIQVVSPDLALNDIREVEVYKASQRNLPPSEFFKEQTLKSWPAFGESQFELSDEDRTMDDTDLGIILASPVLYQHEGQRTISLTLFFEQATFIQLLQYFKNFARVTGKQLQTVSYELLSDAFVISLTTSEGWLEISRYTVRIDMAERNIEVEFDLSAVDPGIGIYDQLTHGEDYQVDWPVVRLLLNNYSTHNPFTFFRKLVLERVTITAKVQGSRSLKLQNNVGTLSPENPFHPFGPQPSVGSFIDIKNTNIFNRFTKDFCVNLEWIDLPREPGGWDTYYRDYRLNITNSSFKVKLSALSQGKFKPLPARRQEFDLFEMEDPGFGPPLLSEVTEIKGVDLKKLELPNKPLMDKEEMAVDTNFTEGAIRLEFTAPAEGFGNKVYPQIFPETIIHNSRRFVKKRPLPNPPHIPVVKGITVSYTLEHSEVLIKTSKNDDSALRIIHQYPYGYEHLYPESDKQPYRFVPDFEYENNLYIGIEDLDTDQDISLLFQLKDTNFTDTASEPAPIIWSYLYENSWVPFEKGKVLYDTTNQFINTGIVKLRLSEDVVKGSTRMDPRYSWLRASSGKQMNKVSEIIGIYLHSASATRVLDENAEPAAMRIPPGSISALKNKVRGLNSIYQLFPSYNGRKAETRNEYDVRVSERLRHRNRLVTNRDIESAILEEFPELLMVKSISPYHGGYDTNASRKIRVIIVPKASREDMQQFERPRVNLALLYQIKNFVKAAISPFAEVEVENPVYEKIKLLGKIKFHKTHNDDVGLLLQTLNEDLKRYLCPWLFESGSSFKIGSQIYMADLLNFIKRRPYVDYITGFSAVHFYNREDEVTGEILAGINDFGQNEQDYIRGSVPEAVIVPAEQHLLTVIDEAAYAEPVNIGVGNLLIAEELIVDDETEPSEINEFTIETENPTEIEYIDLLIGHNIILGNE